MKHIGNLEGLIPLVGGTYTLLLALGVIPAPEEWREKYRGMLVVLSPIVTLFGFAILLGLFSRN
jgi:hypothetical protein